ncbi:hypothetical protein Tco_1484626, partial [Tanacetum coccineum]
MDGARGKLNGPLKNVQALHGLQAPNTNEILKDKTDYRELFELAGQAKRRTEVA